MVAEPWAMHVAGGGRRPVAGLVPGVQSRDGSSVSPAHTGTGTLPVSSRTH